MNKLFPEERKYFQNEWEFIIPIESLYEVNIDETVISSLFSDESANTLAKEFVNSRKMKWSIDFKESIF